MATHESNANDSSSVNQPVKTTPKDALVMAAILKELGVTEYEPRIINQMIEFAYRKYLLLEYIMWIGIHVQFIPNMNHVTLLALSIYNKYLCPIIQHRHFK